MDEKKSLHTLPEATSLSLTDEMIFTKDPSSIARATKRILFSNFLTSILPDIADALNLDGLITAVQESSGPTVLEFGDIADGQYVMRSGTQLVGGSGGGGGGGGGWQADSNTWTYSSADSPIFVASVNADMTGVLQVGWRVKLTQTTVKYFIVHAVGSYSGGATAITLSGGTDYTLANAAISDVSISPYREPIGFPFDTDKWAVTFTDTTQRQQSAPTADYWYNLGSLSFSAPIGLWDAFYSVNGIAFSDSATANRYVQMWITLSSGSASESDSYWTTFGQWRAYVSGDRVIGAMSVFKRRRLSVASKTTYYVNAKRASGDNTDILRFANDTNGGPLMIKLLDVYL